VTILAELAVALATGSIRAVDLTHTLDPDFPVMVLPPEFGQCARFRMEEVSAYDHRGPAWKWNNISMSEHTGTHFDAPVHWVTGKDREDVSQVPAERLIGPAVVIDKTKEATENADYLLTIDDVQAFENQHGPIPDGGWLLLRTGWDERAHNQGAFLNADETGPHTPGFDVDCARWLSEEAPIAGIGVETVGTDAGKAHSFDPPFPCHSFMLGAGKYGVTQLANVSRLPVTGTLLIVAPLKIVKGSGSPCRVLALVPTGG
jgi:kynurenine formamidase